MRELVDFKTLIKASADVSSILGPEKTQMWFFSDNPHFGNTYPLKFWLIGREHKIINFIAEAKENHRMLVENIKL